MIEYEIDNLRFTMQDLTCSYDGDYQLNVQRDGVDQPPHIVRVQDINGQWVLTFDPIGSIYDEDNQRCWGRSMFSVKIPACCMIHVILPWASWAYRHWELYQTIRQ